MDKPCLSCGAISPNSYCAEHTPKKIDKRRGRQRSHAGRSYAWDNLSRRARKLQDHCRDCGTYADLTADHLPSAWHKILITKKQLTLWDIEVVCRSCNSKRGPAIPGSARYAAWAISQGLNPNPDISNPGDIPKDLSPTAPPLCGLPPNHTYSRVT
jgi:5-methylcytosine-specific restriction protein A